MEEQVSVPVVKILELQTVDLNSPVYVLAYVIAIDSSDMGYAICAAQDVCGQKVVKDNDMWACPECEQVLATCKWNLRLKV
jgi:hypothetical protein